MHGKYLVPPIKRLSTSYIVVRIPWCRVLDFDVSFTPARLEAAPGVDIEKCVCTS